MSLYALDGKTPVVHSSTWIAPSASIIGDAELKARIEAIRLAVGERMNLGDVREKSVPKMMLVAPPRNGGAVTVRSFIPADLARFAPAARQVSANPIVLGCRMVKTPAELALMQTATDVTLAAYRWLAPRVETGMTGAEIGALMNAATRKLGGDPEFALQHDAVAAGGFGDVERPVGGGHQRQQVARRHGVERNVGVTRPAVPGDQRDPALLDRFQGLAGLLQADVHAIAGIKNILTHPAIESYTCFLSDITSSAFIVHIEYYAPIIPIIEFNQLRQFINLEVLKLMESLQVDLAGENKEVYLSNK